MQIKAVYGIVQMEENSYLIAVTKASLIGQVFHRKIFQVQKMEYFCLAEQESERDRKYLLGLDELFASKFWYFSDEYDLTNSLQQFVGSNYSLKNKRLEYMYNSDWIDDFIKLKAYEWITGFISGFISIGFTHIGASNSCDIALITRRDKRRQGKRWIVRGADFDGNTANTAETEMVLLTEHQGKEHIFSHVQLRGSMPFIWKQTPDLKWSPKVTIHPSDKLNSDVMRKNYADIKRSYENCTLVNLIDRKGSQGRLGEYLQKMNGAVGEDGIALTWFDFHAECKNMKYENLSKLLDELKNEVENYGYFYLEMGKNEKEGERPARKNMQKGIFRTNCMDCLDRTNVVQSVFARQLLLAWLTKLNLVNKGRFLSAFEKLPDNLEEIFRSQWTKNADAVSILYSGTPAMKTDFTATGKRTSKGAINDGYFGVKRYFLGNFYDARDQDLIDFSLGKIKPAKNKAEAIRHSPCNSLYFLVFFVSPSPLRSSSPSSSSGKWSTPTSTTTPSPSTTSCWPDCWAPAPSSSSPRA